MTATYTLKTESVIEMHESTLDSPDHANHRQFEYNRQYSEVYCINVKLAP